MWLNVNKVWRFFSPQIPRCTNAYMVSVIIVIWRFVVYPRLRGTANMVFGRNVMWRFVVYWWLRGICIMAFIRIVSWRFLVLPEALISTWYMVGLCFHHSIHNKCQNNIQDCRKGHFISNSNINHKMWIRVASDRSRKK